VIIGYGRTSSSLVSELVRTDQRFVVIDNKIGKVDRLERRKVNAIYGNATDRQVLSAASIETARIALITVTDGEDAYACAKLVREMNKGCFILVQVHTDSERAVLCKENLADFVLWPEKLSSRIAMDVVVGSGLASRTGEGPRIDTPHPPCGSALSSRKGKAVHGTDVPDV
jgi:CPA2 family monovalent cation:H+ antiporter-2